VLPDASETAWALLLIAVPLFIPVAPFMPAPLFMPLEALVPLTSLLLWSVADVPGAMALGLVAVAGAEAALVAFGGVAADGAGVVS